MSDNDEPRPLPDAVPQNPACGACGQETRWKDDGFICADCGLFYGYEGASAEFNDGDAAPCLHPCDNPWHEDDAIVSGDRYRCYPCALPEGHQTDHWTGCELVAVGNLAPKDESKKGWTL